MGSSQPQVELHFGILFISGKNYASSPYRIHAYNNIYLFMCKYVERLYEKATSFYQVQLGLEDSGMGLPLDAWLTNSEAPNRRHRSVKGGISGNSIHYDVCVFLFDVCVCVCVLGFETSKI